MGIYLDMRLSIKSVQWASLFVATMFCCGFQLAAGPLALKNASFEMPQLGGEGKQSTNAVAEWKITGTAGVFLNNGGYGNKMAGADGQQLLFLNGAKAGGIDQDLTTEIQAATKFALSAQIGLRKDTPLSKNASLLLRLQAYETNSGKLIRTLGITEVTVGKEVLSAEKLNEFVVSFTTGSIPPKGGLRLSISVGEKSKEAGDWTIDNLRLETQPASAESLAMAGMFRKASAPAVGQSAGAIHYNRDIRPILSENCFTCHGPDSAARKASLRLDRFDDAVAARKGDPAIVPGKPEKSGMIARILTTDPDDVMPPPKSHKKITSDQIDLLKRWVAGGAQYELHWSFLPPEKPALPQVKSSKWIRNPIDRFVLARLEREGLKPAPEADLRTLARRLSLDLTGLPPSPAEVDGLLNDKSSQAYEHYVDRLLGSQHWGEHRGRYWLDAARYADTHGIHFDNFREMWSYRDWVFKAFNANMPFDRFTIEQLAGDLLPNRTMEQQIASGFNRCNITSNEGGLIDEEYVVLYTRDRTETASAVWMGLTANCATCHDHKFDPLTQREFYQMSAFFNNSTTPSRDGNRRDAPPTLVVPTPMDRERWFTLPKELAASKEAVEARRKAARPDYEKWDMAAKPELFTKGVPTNGLVLHAPLNEGEGNSVAFVAQQEKKVSEFGTNSTWGSGYTAAKAFKAGKNSPLAFGDTGDFEKDQPFSCGIWMKIPDKAKDPTGAVVARMDDRNNYRGWDLYLDAGRPATHLVHKWPEDAIKVMSKEKLVPGKWAHVLLTYDGSAKPQGIKFYVNGVATETEMPNKTLTNSIRAQVDLKLAQREKESKLDTISLQDLRVYSRILNSTEAAAVSKDARAAWLVSKSTDKRTKEETAELFERYLGAFDKPYQKAEAAFATLQREETDIKQRGTVAHVFEEKPDEPLAYVLYRGEYDKKRDRVLAGTPQVLPALPEDYPRNRLGFAQWLVRPEHPLTARVTVNRFWQEIFGNGIVKTSGDFGVSGELPSHPELLDWLAVDFRESGWDIKKLFKLIVMSSTYRQAATTTPEKLQRDPQNRLFSRGPRFRMDAEMVRDYALAASGLLVPKIGGPSVKPYQPEGVWEAVAMPESNTRKYEQDKGDKLYRRSVYTFWKRSAPPASLDIFNAPNRETCTVKRERTNTPLQALATLNDPQFIEAARHLAELALKNGGKTAESRLNFIALRLLARPLRPEEQKVMADVLKDLQAHYETSAEDTEALLNIGASKADPTLPKPSFAAYTMAVNQLMNLDEVFNK
jgi:mono/diheme cytochrome c family protein